MSISLGGIEIGHNKPPFVIAEMSGNHNHSLERALAIVDAAAGSGASAIKLQTYTPDTMTIALSEREFLIEDLNSPWKGNSLYKLYEQAHTPWEWHNEIFARAHKRGLIAFSTPFDETAVSFLESMNVPAYKIASFEITDLPLIRTVASKGKPVILSTGMANIAEIYDAVHAARSAGCKDLILLKCTSNYPASPCSSNLAALPYLKTLFNCEIGLSDHTLGIGASVASVALGAAVIEKHFTLARADGGVDAAFSLEPEEFKQLTREVNTAWQALGEMKIGQTEEEKSSSIFRRTLYICEDVQENEVLTPKNLRAIRPGYGLSPKYLDQLMGKKVVKSVKRGTPMAWDLI